MLDKYDGNMKPTSEVTNSIHAGDKVSALFPLEENISRTDDEDLDALFHDGSDDEGNPGLSVWDCSPAPKTPLSSPPSKKAGKRKFDDMADQHDDALPSSSPLSTPISTTSSPAESKTVGTPPTSPAPSPVSSQRKSKSDAPAMSNAPPRYEPVKKKARKADAAGAGTGKADPKPKTESKTSSRPTPIPTTTPKKQPKITQRRVPRDPNRPLPPPVATSTAANDALADDDPAKLWCHCRAPMAERDMILCDNKGCRVGWYHMTCVRVKTVPARWLCAACKIKSGGGVRTVEGPAPWPEWEKRNKKARKGRK